MLKIKDSKNAHKSHTLFEAIEDVKKTEMGQICVPIQKDLRKKFKRKTEDNDTSMVKAIVEYISNYIKE